MGLHPTRVHQSRLEAWEQANMPAPGGANPGASRNAVHHWEARFGHAFPEDYAAWLEGTEGAKLEALDWLLGTLEQAWHHRETMGALGVRPGASRDERVQPVFWHDAWWPFGWNDAGDYLVLDMAPGVEGDVGQVVHVDHEQPAHRCVAPSFAAWLAGEVQRLDASTWDEELGQVVQIARVLPLEALAAFVRAGLDVHDFVELGEVGRFEARQLPAVLGSPASRRCAFRPGPALKAFIADGTPLDPPWAATFAQLVAALRKRPVQVPGLGRFELRIRPGTTLEDGRELPRLQIPVFRAVGLFT